MGTYSYFVEIIFSSLRGLYRLVLFVLFLTTYLTWSYLCHWTIRDPLKRLNQFSRNTRFFCGWMLRALGLELSVVNQPTDGKNFLLVSNHLGFIDILILASRFPTLFVTSIEMKETPLLGTLTEMGGCIYVERRSRTKILDELKAIVEVLKQGFCVTLYPESVSTNGERVLPFKKTLMMAAAEAGVPIQPAVVNFRSINGDEFTTKWRDHVCWYGDIPFQNALWKTLTLKSVKAEVEFLDKVYISKDEDRSQVAEKIHAMIAAKYAPVKVVESDKRPAVEVGIDPT
jgi:1-acyl-sn-glycerol-3-phosphate acyltransferase